MRLKFTNLLQHKQFNNRTKNKKQKTKVRLSIDVGYRVIFDFFVCFCLPFHPVLFSWLNIVDLEISFLPLIHVIVLSHDEEYEFHPKQNISNNQHEKKHLESRKKTINCTRILNSGLEICCYFGWFCFVLFVFTFVCCLFI